MELKISGIYNPVRIVVLVLMVSNCLSLSCAHCLEFNKPVPACKSKTDALSYHDIPVAYGNPLFAEPLVELKKEGIAGEAYYSRKDKLNYPYCKALTYADKQQLARRTVVNKLKQVNAVLAASELEVFILDAFRPVKLQAELWRFFLAEAGRQHPYYTQAEKVVFAGKYCSNPEGFDPKNSHTWPSHCTGGAIDLTLRRKDNGELLYMGNIFDDASEISHTDYFEEQNHLKTQSDYAARQNRRLLYWAMRSAGFVNYPKEWWHFDYGTQMGVYNARTMEQISDSKALWGPAQHND